MNHLRYTMEGGKPYCGKCMQEKDRKAGAHKDREYHDAKSQDTDVSRAITAIATLGEKPKYGGGSSSLSDVVTGKSGKEEAVFCVSCKTSVAGFGVSTSKGKYHEKCFKCGGCKAQLSQDDGFMFVGEQPYHTECGKKAQSGTCGVCGAAATGKCASAKGMKIHVACFVCCVCKKDLSGGFLAGDPGKFFCGSKCKETGPPPPSSSSGPKASQASGPSGQRFCGSCGTMNSGGSKFCSECGATF
eukprot:TRINITY_DN3589_c0_g1_i16.p1 TRINITY_DN3589_c0_g1~~TRINITY_DN3589_c0_g1_i16.p1  ORF type:complete len:244 (+),score=17.89 TRINITY_DN3589_c0_g1_i16:142-873(+)